MVEKVLLITLNVFVHIRKVLPVCKIIWMHIMVVDGNNNLNATFCAWILFENNVCLEIEELGLGYYLVPFIAIFISAYFLRKWEKKQTLQRVLLYSHAYLFIVAPSADSFPLLYFTLGSLFCCWRCNSFINCIYVCS